MHPSGPKPEGTKAKKACKLCIESVEVSRKKLDNFTKGAGQRALFVGCVCKKKTPIPLFSHQSEKLMPAASIIKLAWVLAAIRAHNKGTINLASTKQTGDIPHSRHRDGLAPLPANTKMPWIVLIGLGLVTSANPIFDNLSKTPGLATHVKNLDMKIEAVSGFNDNDLKTRIRSNRVTANAAAQLLTAVVRESIGELAPVVWGLENGSRTTRLVRDVDDQPGLPKGLHAPNKTGSLRGVRNDVALFHKEGTGLVVAALTDSQPTTSHADSEMAELAAELVDARWSK